MPDPRSMTPGAANAGSLPGVALRAAVAADRDSILVLQCRSLRELGRSRYSERQIESYLRHAETLEPYLVADGTYFVASAGDRLAGCGGWSLRSPGYAAVTGASTCAGSARMPRLRAMYVHPGFARRGIGSLLVAAIEREILAAGFCEAAVDATLPGVTLYERCGYRATGEIRAELPDGETLGFVCMRKRLGPGSESGR